MSLSDAQFRVAREYGFASWPKLKAHVDALREVGQLKAAIDANDVVRVQSLMTRKESLHRAPLGYRENGPLTWAAECRGAPPSPERLAIIRWLLANGSDVHQGGDGPLMRAALRDERIPVMELLVEYGADVNARWNGEYPIICAPCETLAPRALEWLIAQGADMNATQPDGGNCLRMLVGTYWRNPEGKGPCLQVFADAGYPLPDTAPMAVHRGRTDLLAACLARDASLLKRHFREAEIYPPELGLAPGDGLTYAPLDGGTLLHIAVEYLDANTAQWLIDQGADVNARAAIDTEGFGGQTPLFHTVVSPFARAAELTRWLLQNGADPNARATFRKRLSIAGDVQREQMHEYHDVTPLGFARVFQEPRWVNDAALEVLREHGGG